jgi:tRNA-dihydrouridine synthase B
MYTGRADHALTAELVACVPVPVIASGDIVSREAAASVLERTGAAAVMVGRAAQGNPWALAEIVGDYEAAAPSRQEVAGELLFFIGETVRELGERRATGFLKKFYGWYLGHGRFPKPFRQELVQLATIAEVEQRLLAAEPRSVDVAERLREESKGLDELLLRLPISAFGGG